MATTYPAPASAAPRKFSPARPPQGRPAGAITDTCRYNCPPRSRGLIAASVLITAALQAGIFFGFGPPKKKPAPPAIPVIKLIDTAQIKELQDAEPEAVPDEGASPKEAVTISVPMQVDLPALPSLTDFVQPFDFSTLIQRPTPNANELWSIPVGPRHGGKNGDGIGNIFNLKDLDRAPEPTFQPSPIYPSAMSREGVDGTVIVEFIVDTQGRVINAVMIDSTNIGFQDAAIQGVAKWKFHPGVRGGRKVNTRMRVPINFRVATATH